MPAAVVGGAIAATGAVASAAIGSSAAKKASKASQQAADTSAAVQRETYAQNKEILSPFVGRGNVAGDYINAFLGLPGQQTTAAPAPQTSVPAGTTARTVWPQYQAKYGDSWYGRWLVDYNNGVPSARAAAPAPATGNVTTSTPGVTQADAQNAFGDYIDNSDYGFQFATGSNAVNSGYAGAGTLQSGAAMKALEEYRQNLQAGYRNEYMNALGNQQGVGLSAGSALAGVGQNYANSLGSIYTNNAANQANAALVNGQNIGNAINSVATIGSNIFGAK